MSPRRRAFFQFATLLLVAVILFLLFRPAASFAEMAARELRYFWWLVLLIALGIWLIWSGTRQPKK